MKTEPHGQLRLFEGRPRPVALARAGDPDSSHSAAAEVEQTGEASRQRDVVLQCVLASAGLTSRELAQKYGGHVHLDRFQFARRLPELETIGAVRKGMARKCKAIGARGMAVTWWATAVALERPEP